MIFNLNRIPPPAYLLAVACVVCVVAPACVQDPKDAPPDRPLSNLNATKQLTPEYDASGKLRKLEYDRNNDGKADSWGYMDGARVVRVKVDKTGEGRGDRWESPREPRAAAASGGGAAVDRVDQTVERIERATRF